MKPVFFSDQYRFRQWLEEHHASEKELIVGYYKVGTGKPSMTWSESVDQAICFGWIDGIRKTVDAESYCIRFTPRKATSNWSKVNIEKAENMIKFGLMHRSGLEIYNRRKIENSGIYSYENEEPRLTPEYEKKFRENVDAWDYFSNQTPPSYRKTVIRWVMFAKQEATRIARLGKLITASELQKRMY
ncbi:MAG: bacteriocin-protection protein [Bacteroidetes bacterium]|nr:bacteriocin-protection protein [Bacteroidota bacterium]